MRRMMFVVCVLFTFVALFSLRDISVAEDSANAGVNPQQAAFADPVLAEQEKLFFELLNAHRAALGRCPLTPCPNLMFGARRWATWQGYGHASNGFIGRRSVSRPFNGECIAPAADAKTAFRIWLKSPGHRRIMTGEQYCYGGIGFNRGRAILRVSVEPWPVQDTTSIGKYVMRTRFFKRSR
jgi:uncharacterized protein YkwD